MNRRLVSGLVAGALAAAVAGSVAAQPKADPKGYMAGTAGCDAQNCGYVLSATGAPDNNVVKSGVYNGALGLAGNLCYRTGYWAPSMAIVQCDPDLVPKPPAPPPPPPPPAAARRRRRRRRRPQWCRRSRWHRRRCSTSTRRC